MSRARTTSAATAGHLCFETYYDTREGYTLKKMTTEEYVRDARFAPIALGFDDGEGRKGWVSAARIPDHLLERFDWDRTAVLAHHAAFDDLALT